jgi:hypothetical protein
MCRSAAEVHRQDARPQGLGWALMPILLLAVMAGCGPRGPERFRVSGTVTHAGKPVQLGRVVFEPDTSRGNDGPQGFTPIENGRFDTAGPHCKGTVGGPMRVRIDGFEMTGGEDAAASGKLLFPLYQEAIDLPRADVVRDFVVPATGGR